VEVAALVTRAPVTRDAGSPVRLLRGRFEAQFEDAEAAQGAARDARAVGFSVVVQQGTRGWLAIARRQLPFPDDERDRYASRFEAIARQRGGALTRFVEEPPDAI
jgi:hypothetical protein